MGKNKKNKNVAVNNAEKDKKVDSAEKVEKVESNNDVKNENKKVESKVENKDQNKNENKKENKNNKKEEVKKEVKEVKMEETKKEEKLSEKKQQALIKKAKKTSGNDTKIIVGIVAAVIIIALGVFGFYFYKVNMESVISYDGGKISNSDYEVYYKTFATMLQYYGYPETEIPNQIAEKAALDAIILKMAKEAGINISDEDKASVDKVFNDKEQIATFTEQGIDIGKMRNLYISDYIIAAYLEKMIEEEKDEDVIAYIKSMNEKDAEIDLNQYNTSHILFKIADSEGKALDDAAKAEKKKKAEETLQRIKNGEDFATLAKELSEDTTKTDGGKFTMYSDGNVMEEYETAVKSLKDGEVYATIVETSAGYHIIKLDSKVENGRSKNKTEREEYVNSKIDKLAEEKNVKVDKEGLNKLVEKITGKKVGENSETDKNSSGNQTTEDTTDTNTEETQNNQ